MSGCKVSSYNGSINLTKSTVYDRSKIYLKAIKSWFCVSSSTTSQHHSFWIIVCKT